MLLFSVYKDLGTNRMGIVVHVWDSSNQEAGAGGWEVKIILSYIMNSKPSWATWYPALKRNNTNKQAKRNNKKQHRLLTSNRRKGEMILDAQNMPYIFQIYFKYHNFKRGRFHFFFFLPAPYYGSEIQARILASSVIQATNPLAKMQSFGTEPTFWNGGEWSHLTARGSSVINNKSSSVFSVVHAICLFCSMMGLNVEFKSEHSWMHACMKRAEAG